MSSSIGSRFVAWLDYLLDARASPITTFVVTALFVAVVLGIARAKDFLSARQAALLANEHLAPSRLLYFSHVCLVVGVLWYALGALWSGNVVKATRMPLLFFQRAGAYLQAAGALLMGVAVVVASALIAIGDEAGASQILNMRPYFFRPPGTGQTLNNNDGKAQTV